MIKIQERNNKMGKVSHINLPPVMTCPPGVPCAKDGCYALNSYRMFPNVRESTDANYRAYLDSPAKYFQEISDYLIREKVKLFRFHASGDIPSLDYFNRMVVLAKKHPNTRFLAFTKIYMMPFSYMLTSRTRLPRNLKIVISIWPGLPIPMTTLPKAFMQDGTETRIPRSAKECSGKCESCKICWEMKRGQSVFFYKHGNYAKKNLKAK